MIFLVTMVVWGFVNAETALITLAVLTVSDWMRQTWLDAL